MPNMELAALGAVPQERTSLDEVKRRGMLERGAAGLGHLVGKVLSVALCPYSASAVEADVSHGSWAQRRHPHLAEYSTERTQTRRT